MSHRPRNIFLIRHGQRLDHVQPQWMATAQRPYDCPLTPQGAIQAQETGRALLDQDIAHVFCSPFLRALETAAQIVATLGHKTLKVEPGLAEALYQRWFPYNPQLPSPQEASAGFPIDLEYQAAVELAYPESALDMLARTAAAATSLLRRFPGNQVWVSHGGAIQGLGQALCGSQAVMTTPCCCLIHIRQDEPEGPWRVIRDGSDTSHLSVSEDVIRVY